jgi:translocation and assembly module TamB
MAMAEARADPVRRSRSSVRPPRRDLGRSLARFFCAVLALVGVTPFLAALLLSSGPLQRWAEREAARVLRQELGLSARYRVELRLLPLRLAVLDLVVPASDGGSPAVTAESVTVAPRVFALFGGRLDLGEIEVRRPRTRLVLEDGKIKNLSYRLPDQRSTSRSQRAPFTTLSITEGRFRVELPGVVGLDTGPVDVDVFADKGPSFEIALQADESRIVRKRVQLIKEVPTTGKEVIDDDLVCRLEARVRIAPERLDVRRLSLLATLDDFSGPGRKRGCEVAGENDPRGVMVRVSQLHLTPRHGKTPLFAGHVVTKSPLILLNRFVPALPLGGTVAFSGDIRYDGSFELPELDGKLTAKGIAMGPYRIAQDLAVDARVAANVVHVPRIEMGFADGRITVRNVRVEPLKPGVPISVEAMDQSDVPFTSLMRDLNVTPRTIVSWNIKETHARRIHGSLAPLRIEGDLTGDTRDFEITNKAWNNPSRHHMLGIKRATLRGKFRVLPKTLDFFDIRTDFGKSSVYANLVSIGYASTINLKVAKGSKIDLSDLSPLVDIPWSGQTEVDVELAGDMSDPLLTGNLKIQNFEFGGFPIGDVKSAKVKFRPLWVEFYDVQGQKGSSAFTLPSARLDFDTGATLVADATMKTNAFDLREFLSIWHFENDLRWTDLRGVTKADARVRYVLGGKDDPCGTGLLVTSGKLEFKFMDLWGEHYDSGEADFKFRWFDRLAGYQGMELSVPGMVLRKDPGTIVGSFDIRSGGKVRGHLVASDVPLAKLDAMPALLRSAEGRASGVAEFEGSIDALSGTGSGRLSPVRVGRTILPASEFRYDLTPIPDEKPAIGKTACGAPITAPFDQTEWEADKALGVFDIAGSLFGGQVRFDKLAMTRQRSKLTRGRVTFDALDLAAVAELFPAFALSDSRLEGKLSGTADLSEWRVADPLSSRASIAFSELSVMRAGYSAKVLAGSQSVNLAGGAVSVPGLSVLALTPTGHRATFDLNGTVSELRGSPRVDGKVALRPMDLSALTQAFPRVERAKGTVSGRMAVSGPLRAPSYTGGLELTGGEVAFRGLPSPISELDLAVKLDAGEVHVTRGSARFGSGKLAVTGGAPLHGFDLGTLRLGITARDLALPLGEGVKATADADLTALWKSAGGGERSLPKLSGNVLLRSFEYRRPVTMTAELQALGRRGKRTSFESYDPAEDLVDLDITVKAARALTIKNELVEADLTLADEGLLLAGTNGRFGLRGTVEVKPGGRITLRRSVFEVTQGTVRFDDLTRIAPNVDVTAVTEYRRYAESSASSSSGAAAAPSGGSTSVAGGHWTIRMHAHGDADDLKIDLTSDPALAQDDVFLLLTVGLTRAELDQAQSASVGESVALEALGTLSGADRAVTKAVPVIDEFRFGSSYSSRTGRTEPTVTIGKRLTDRVRANVTTGLAESREVRSNLEWRLSNRVSVESSYDNVNDISSSALGNLGADVRWRLEFE